MNLVNSHNLKYFIKKKRVGSNSTINFSCVYFSNCSKFPDYKSTISNLPRNSAVIYREYNLSKTKRQELALKIQKICQKYQHKFIIGKDLDLARKLKACGVHFSDRDRINPVKKEKNMISTLSCHNINNIKKSKNADLLFFSPIFATNSHPEAKQKGLLQLKLAQKSSKKPIFALGGVNNSNINKILNYCDGIGGIEIFQEN